MRKYFKLITAFVLLIAVQVYAAPQNTSSTTGTTIITRARYLLNETTPGFWDDTELMRWTNDGIWDIASKTLSVQGEESISLVADTREYTPTTSYFKVITVLFTNSDGDTWPLIKSSVNTINGGVAGRLSNSDSPKYWYEFGGKIGIFPAMSSVTTETLTVYFAEQPTDIAASENVPTPAIFDRCLVDYVVAMALWKDSKVNLFDAYWKKYASEIDRYRLEFVEQPTTTDKPVD